MADDSWRVPKPVQELAAGLQQAPPSRYVQREQDRPGGLLLAADMPEPIPVVDLSRLPSDAGEAAKLRSALATWGLVIVTNHGVEAYVVDGLTEAAREFFRQPMEEKLKCSNLVEGKRFRLEGYGNDPVMAQDQILDWNDRLHLNMEPEEHRDLAQWPQHPEPFRDLMLKYASKIKTVRDNILRAMAEILELDEDYFISQMGDKAEAVARFNYYPPCPMPELVFGLKPHTDGSLLTVVLLDRDVGGLQVQRDGVWFNVPSIPDTLLINMGDSMEIMCNGIFKSPVHRVVTNADKERMSLAMFYGVGSDKVLEPAPGLLDEKRPARYRRITVKDFAAGLHEHFSKGTKIMETLKI
ncbi:hypothetical protein ACP4OV_006616 [Aristida adscensionis]